MITTIVKAKSSGALVDSLAVDTDTTSNRCSKKRKHSRTETENNVSATISETSNAENY